MVQSLSRKMPEEPVVVDSIVNDKKLSVYTFNTLVSFPQTQLSNISVYVGVEDKNIKNSPLKSIHQIDYTYWPIQVESCGTYELITPQSALEKIQAGEGSLVYLYDSSGDDVSGYTPRRVKKFMVLDINIVYYESREELEYLQPIYVISGEAIFENDTKGTFDYYYPAINYDIVQNKIELPKAEVVEEKSFF